MESWKDGPCILLKSLLTNVSGTLKKESERGPTYRKSENTAAKANATCSAQFSPFYLDCACSQQRSSLGALKTSTGDRTQMNRWEDPVLEPKQERE